MGKSQVEATTRKDTPEGARSPHQPQPHLLVPESGWQQHGEHHQGVGNRNRLQHQQPHIFRVSRGNELQFWYTWGAGGRRRSPWTTSPNSWKPRSQCFTLEGPLDSAGHRQRLNF